MLSFSFPILGQDKGVERLLKNLFSLSLLLTNRDNAFSFGEILYFEDPEVHLYYFEMQHINV